MRAAFPSGSFAEGWAVYAEELVAAAGLGLRPEDDDALRMQRLKMLLRSTINAILDVRVHAHGMTEGEALRLMIDRGHQEEGEAAGKWRRALLSSAQLSTYYAGYHEGRDAVGARVGHIVIGAALGGGEKAAVPRIVINGSETIKRPCEAARPAGIAAKALMGGLFEEFTGLDIEKALVRGRSIATHENAAGGEAMQVGDAIQTFVAGLEGRPENDADVHHDVDK